MRLHSRSARRPGLAALVAAVCLLAVSCSGGGGSGGGGGGKTGGKGGGKGGGRKHEEKAAPAREPQKLPDVPSGEIRYVYLSTAGKSSTEAAVLPLRYYEVFFPVMPIPPQTATDYDQRLAARNMAVQMVEKKNMLFLNALNAAGSKLDYKKDWQQSYDEFLKAGHAPGGWLSQLDAALKSGEPCPNGACGAGSPAPEGCPHTHPGTAQWAPDGSLLAVFRLAFGEGKEQSIDTVMLDFGCQKH